MGQQVAVVEKPSPRPGLLRLETNRSLTGMGHERFATIADAIGPRPAAVIARQLLSTGRVDAVHVYGNIISVDVAKGYTTAGLADLVRNMYQYWKPGMEMPTFEAPVEEAAPAPAAVDGGDVVESTYTRLVPPSLRERSAAAMARWRAAH